MIKADDYCFVCGKDNPIGIKAKFKTAEGYSSSELVLSKEYQGWSNIIHGGIIAAVLDEACVYAGNSLGFNTVTAELKVRFKKPLTPNERVIVEAHAKVLKSKLIIAQASLRSLSGETFAEAEGKLIAKEKAE